MAVINVPVFDFKSGVLTPKLRDRANLELYKSGVLVGKNFLTQVHGPQEFRSGFHYIRTTRRNRPAVLIPFSFDDDEAYVLEFTEGYLRFYTNGEIMTEPSQDIEDISQEDPGVITITGHGLETGDEIFISGVGGMTELNGTFYLVVKIDDDNFSLTDQDGDAIDTEEFDEYTSGGTVAKVYEIFAPYKEEHLRRIKYAGRGDIMYLDCPFYAPRKIIRRGSVDWELGAYERTNDPFDQRAITGITQADPGVVTANDHGFETGDRVKIEEVSGMNEVNGEEYEVTVINSNTFSIEDTTEFSEYTEGGVVMLVGNAPATVGFYGGRVYHGGSLNDPDILFGSKGPDLDTGEPRYEDFTVGSDKDDAVVHALRSATPDSVDRIRFFIGTRQFLAVGTYAGMLKVNGGSDTQPITGTDIESFPVDSYGAADMMPVVFGTNILYTQRGNQTLFSFQYSLMNDGFESIDEMLQADEIGKERLIQLAFVQGKPNRMWACTGEGNLLSLTHNPHEDVSAWNGPHSLGGGGKVISIATEPQDDKEFLLYAVVERVVEGTLRRYVEYKRPNPAIPEQNEFYTGDQEGDIRRYYNLLFESQKRQVHLDSCLILDTTQTSTVTLEDVEGDEIEVTCSAPIFSEGDIGRWIRVKYITGDESGIARIIEYESETEVKCEVLQKFHTLSLSSGQWYFTQDTVSGFDHLEGETLTLLADGGVVEDKVVENGTVSLEAQTSYLVGGLSYTGLIETMPLELLLNMGITPGKTKTISQINLMFRNSLGVSYGYDPYNLQRIGFRRGGQFTDRPTRLFSGVKDLPGFDLWDAQRHVWVVQKVPYPCTLNAMVVDTDMEFDTGGGG